MTVETISRREEAIARAIRSVELRWTLPVVRQLRDGPQRPSRIQNACPGLRSEGLRVALTRMTKDGLVVRTHFNTYPRKVTYELTPQGYDLLRVVDALETYASRWAPALGK